MHKINKPQDTVRLPAWLRKRRNFIFVLHDSMLSSASSERFVCMIAIGRAFIPLCIIYCFVPEYHVNCMTVIRGVTLVFVQDWGLSNELHALPCPGTQAYLLGVIPLWCCLIFKGKRELLQTGKKNRRSKTTDTYLGVDKIIFGDDFFVFVSVEQKEFCRILYTN